ncbi:MAG: CvpA family protein [Bacteroidales bacterium]|nr:CvpA family protein [Bacteroidales bacterium]
MVLDIALICVFCWAGYLGYTKGFILQAATLIALALGILGGIYFSDMIAGLIQQITHTDSEYLPIISFAVIFVAILIGVYFLAHVIEKFLKVVALSLLNRIVGILFNLAKYILIVSATLAIINSLDSQQPFLPKEVKEESKLYKPLSNIAPGIYPYLKFKIEERKQKSSSPDSDQSESGNQFNTFL